MGRGTFCGFFDIITGMENEQLTAENDTRNMIDEFKGLSNEDVKSKLDQSRSGLEVAIENVEHDFNVGTIVRSANNFNVSAVHIIGRHKYNRRGAMCTDKYLTVKYWASAEEFLADQRERGRVVVAIENNTPRARALGTAELSEKTTLVFGSEGNGITAELLEAADEVRFIESFGSTRSVNVGVAAGIAMYEWTRQNIIHKK